MSELRGGREKRADRFMALKIGRSGQPVQRPGGAHGRCRRVGQRGLGCPDLGEGDHIAQKQKKNPPRQRLLQPP